LRFFTVWVAALLIAARPAPPRPQNLNAIERGIFEAINQVRRQHGRAPLLWNDRLAAEARRHSRSMAEHWFFSHTDPARGALAARLNEDKIPWRACAENIFQETGYEDPVKAAVDGWMRSPGHRSNILNRLMTETGVGAAFRGSELFVTQDFLRPPERQLPGPGRR
jgi:uncharacterized protein YkwD